MIFYGYVRISTKHQSLERQIKNLKRFNQDIEIYQEVFTGTELDNRKVYRSLKNRLKVGDTLVFDSVSRMSRNANEGISEYFDLMNKGINLIFLKERYIDTQVYKEQIKINNTLKINDKDLNDTILEGIRLYLKRIAIKQIEIAFKQSEKEVQDLKIRTKEALKIKKEQGVLIGRKFGSKIETAKSKATKKNILKLSKNFNGTLKDKEIIEILKISRNSYYKYKKELSLSNR